MIDSHSHTFYSKHAIGTVDELVRASIAAGVTVLPLIASLLTGGQLQAAEKPAAYRWRLEKPRCTPPVPKPAEPAPHAQVDLSRVVVGGQLRHKAFGMGTVKEIRGGLIIVLFGGTEKKFQFPGALLQGFLSLPE